MPSFLISRMSGASEAHLKLFASKVGEKFPGVELDLSKGQPFLVVPDGIEPPVDLAKLKEFANDHRLSCIAY